MKKSKNQSRYSDQHNKYYIHRKLFWIPIFTTITLLLVIFLTQGYSAFTKSAEVDCPIYYQEEYCEITIGDNIYKVNRGEKVVLNDQESLLVKITNYSIWVQLILLFGYNHLRYNRKS